MKYSDTKTACIITINDFSNYGNRLQNYAVQNVLKKLGFNSVTLFPLYNPNSFTNRVRYYVHKLTNFQYTWNKEYWRNWRLLIAKAKVFDIFNKKSISFKVIKKISDIMPTDYYVLGSDQVWNAEWYPQEGIIKEIFLLSFADPERRVCFSPSFGIEELPTQWIPWFKEQLAKFPMISVREESGARIVRELTGKEATVTIDPTLMLDKDEWMKIAAKPERVDCDSKYILTYFLGETTDKVRSDVDAYAEQIDAGILDLMDTKCPQLYATGPAEFIYLISNATLILTDSFHACVFSFLFGKPFLLYKREGVTDMMSRIDTLFEKFDLKRKYVGSGLQNELLECDYSSGYSVLELERKKLIHFLKESMQIYCLGEQL